MSTCAGSKSTFGPCFACFAWIVFCAAAASSGIPMSWLALAAGGSRASLTKQILLSSNRCFASLGLFLLFIVIESAISTCSRIGTTIPTLTSSHCLLSCQAKELVRTRHCDFPCFLWYVSIYSPVGPFLFR